MSPRAPRTALLAAALAACSPAAEQRGAGVPSDTPASVAGAATTAGAGTATAGSAGSAGSAVAPADAPSAARNVPALTGSESTADSVRGVVERIGSDPTTQLVVRGADGVVCTLRMTAAALEGLEVALWGARDRASATMLPGVTCTLAVARYAVRAVDGIAATDGVLRAQGDAYALETAGGLRRPLRDVPPTLRAQVGARIFWAGPLDRAPAAYGVLVAASR